LIYNRIEGLHYDREKLRQVSKQTEWYKGNYSGLITPHSQKRLTRAIELLIAISKPKTILNMKTKSNFNFRVNFITLTLPAPQREVSDIQLKDISLQQFIRNARRKYKLTNYVWRAERQKNGNLHFHMLSDVFIHHQKLRELWNESLLHFHFINEFFEKHGHRNPNSTDVHSVIKVRDLPRYMAKYMGKLEKKAQSIEGKVWDCSKNLKTKNNCELVMDSELNDTINRLITEEKVRMMEKENCTLLFFNETKRDEILDDRMKREYNTWIEGIRKVD
jgi:hypothetical protein